MKMKRQKASEISSRLNTRFVGKQLYYYDVLTSTMNKAREKALKGAVEGTTIIADEQTSGRGRMGRTWLSPQGNIALSLILKPDLEHLPSLVMIASLAVLRTIKKMTNIDAVIKWPNDVLIKDKKVSGILIENEVRDRIVNYTIIGIGLNIYLDISEYPEISTIATSLWQAKPQTISKPEIMATLLAELERLYLAAKKGAPIHEEWRAHLDTLGKWVEIKCGDIIEQGIAVGVMANGNLLLRQANGNTTEILAGDVTVLKR
jgi:BirA family biotin operon repressor/biotin-[acetyl-CoA-carboxylase] ligase